MKKKTVAPKIVRKPRSDAQRNRERILEVARQVFTRRGADASMDEIAKRAKIGPGTLYRHFPTRDELLATVYITEVEKLAAAQKRLSANLPPIEALRRRLARKSTDIRRHTPSRLPPLIGSSRLLS
jgi:AcrR family transcriptional regulator